MNVTPVRTRIAAVLACSLTLAAGMARADDVRGAITAVNAAVGAAFAKGDAAAVAGFYAPDGQVLPVGMDPVKGTEALKTFWQGAMKAGVAGVTLSTIEVYPAGNTATEVGTYVLTDKSGKQIDHGKYVVIWRKVGLQWKLLRDIFSTNVSAAPK